jgi:integrase
VSIYKRRSGRYTVVVARAEGSIERRSLGTFSTRKEAEKAEREALAARDRGTDLVPQTLTLTEVFSAYMAEAEADGLSETTLRGYRETFRRCETIATIKLARLKPLHLAQLRAKLLSEGWSGGAGPLSPRSVRNTLALVSTLLAWGVEHELIARNVAAVARLRRRRAYAPQIDKKPTRHYERADAERLISEASKTRYGPMIVFAFETGLRRGELAGLRWDDVAFGERYATIKNAVAYVPGRKWLKDTKTHLVARIALSEIAIAALRAQRAHQAKDKLAAGPFYDDQGFVFAPGEGGMYSPGAVYDAVHKIAKRAGLSLRNLHGIRHSTGSWLVRAGVDVTTVAAILRHSTPSTTLAVYSHELEGAQAEAVERVQSIPASKLA